MFFLFCFCNYKQLDSSLEMSDDDELSSGVYVAVSDFFWIEGRKSYQISTPSTTENCSSWSSLLLLFNLSTKTPVNKVKPNWRPETASRNKIKLNTFHVLLWMSVCLSASLLFVAVASFIHPLLPLVKLYILTTHHPFFDFRFIQ